MKKINKSNIIIMFLFLLLITPRISLSKEDKEMTKEEYLAEISNIKERLQNISEDPELHNTLGFYLFKIGNYDDAVKEYTAAIKYDKNFPTPYNNLGVISLLKNDFERAEEYFKDAVELDPKYAKAVYNLGVTYFKQKKYIKAVRSYLQAKKVDKEYVKERGDLKKGKEELKKELEKDPDNKVLKHLLEKANEEDI